MGAVEDAATQLVQGGGRGSGLRCPHRMETKRYLKSGCLCHYLIFNFWLMLKKSIMWIKSSTAFSQIIHL